MNIIKLIIKRYKEPQILDLVVVWGIFTISCAMILFHQKVKINELGDAMGGIFGTFISTLTLIFVIYGYQLQREELKKTSEGLKGQEDFMKLQRVQSLIIDLLRMADNHLNEFERFIKDTHSSWQGDLIRSYRVNGNNLESDYDKNLLSSLIKYFQTIKYAENLIMQSLLAENIHLGDELINLIKSQISSEIT